MAKNKAHYGDYQEILQEVHRLADDEIDGWADPRAKLLLHIINEIELGGHDEKTFEDNDASECFVHDEISYASEDLESKIEALEERIKKLEAKL
jgi:hypothetical protein